MIELLIYGAGGFAREVAWLAQTCARAGQALELVGFIDDEPDRHGRRLHDHEVMSLPTAVSRFPGASVIGGIGSPRAREATMRRASDAGLQAIDLIHPGTEWSDRIDRGSGLVVCAGNILTVDIRIGTHVQINLGCTIGHDVILDDYATLAPGVHVSGWVHVARGAYVGTGAVIVNGVEGRPILIGEGAVVGAGACVTKDVPPGCTVVGVPARPLPRSPGHE